MPCSTWSRLDVPDVKGVEGKGTQKEHPIRTVLLQSRRGEVVRSDDGASDAPSRWRSSGGCLSCRSCRPVCYTSRKDLSVLWQAGCGLFLGPFVCIQRLLVPIVVHVHARCRDSRMPQPGSGVRKCSRLGSECWGTARLPVERDSAGGPCTCSAIGPTTHHLAVRSLVQSKPAGAAVGLHLELPDGHLPAKNRAS